jgi:hypothetical protein
MRGRIGGGISTGNGWRIGMGVGLALALLAPAARAVEEAHASARVADPPEAVWALLADFPHWDRVFPTVTSVAVEIVDDRHVRLHTLTRVAGQTVRYTLAAEVDAAARRIDCTLDPDAPSDVLALASHWRVRPSAGGGSRIELAVRSESGLGLPRFLERRVTEHSTRGSMAALVAALEEQRRQPAPTASRAPKATRVAATD